MAELKLEAKCPVQRQSTSWSCHVRLTLGAAIPSVTWYGAEHTHSLSVSGSLSGALRTPDVLGERKDTLRKGGGEWVEDLMLFLLGLGKLWLSGGKSLNISSCDVMLPSAHMLTFFSTSWCCGEEGPPVGDLPVC